jgi:hypothetical protein
VLASQEVSATVFAHGSWAEGSIGFVCRHLGEEAFGERRSRIKNRAFKRTCQTNILYKADGYIDAKKKNDGGI